MEAAVPYTLVRAELLERLLPLAAALCGSASIAAAAARRVLRRVPRRRLPGQGGTTELEFALALPFFLLSVLTTVQIALMINATLIVDYAAFCAARSASVWVPEALPNEPAHTIASSDGEASEKRARIHRAAAFACLPISPRWSRLLYGVQPPRGTAALDPASLGRLAEMADVQPDRRIDYARLALRAVDKWLYAQGHTAVELLDAAGRPRSEFPPGAPIAARVTHDFEMAVPLAGPLLGRALGERYFPIFGGYYVPLTASYTLMAWGDRAG